jgi:hypothetical protein
MVKNDWSLVSIASYAYKTCAKTNLHSAVLKIARVWAIVFMKVTTAAADEVIKTH